MSDTISAEGSCICGACSIAASSVSLGVGACHCKTCQNWGGGPLLSASSGTEVVVSGGDKVKVYNSSEWAERGFCGQCGTHLFYRIKSNQSYHLPVGLFVGPAFQLEHEVFVDSKSEWLDFHGETKKMTGAEVFAMFAPKE